MERLIFKFKNDASEEQRQAIIRTLIKKGVDEVRHLFPADKEDDMSSLFVADVKTEHMQQNLVRILGKMNEIEFAESDVKRKLIR
jgi:hypothetical protein